MADLSKLLAESPARKALWTYWDNLRGDQAIPRASQLRPEDLLALGVAPIYSKWVGDEEIVTLMTTSEMSSFVGHELTGENLLDRIAEHARSDVRDYFKKIMQGPCGGVTEYSALMRSGLSGRGKSFTLPLADNEGTPMFFIAHVSKFQASGTALAPDKAVYANEFFEAVHFDIGFGQP